MTSSRRGSSPTRLSSPATWCRRSGTRRTHTDKVEALGGYARDLLAVDNDLEPRIYLVHVADGIDEYVRGRQIRAASRTEVRGMKLAIPEINEYTQGISRGS
jgi:hypothetical protein